MYHPSQLEASKSTASAFLSSRVKAFLFLMDNDWFRDVSLSYGHSKGVVRIMDAGNWLGGTRVMLDAGVGFDEYCCWFKLLGILVGKINFSISPGITNNN